MTDQGKNPAKNANRRKRLRLVEELILNGFKTREIFDMVGTQYGVTYGTIRNDVVHVRKAHKDEINSQSELKGREVYLASILQLRRKSLTGWPEVDRFGTSRIKGRDFKLAHELDKEIARLSGVNIKSDEKTVHLTVEKARSYLDSIMQVVFDNVQDEATRARIVAGFAELDEAD